MSGLNPNAIQVIGRNGKRCLLFIDQIIAIDELPDETINIHTADGGLIHINEHYGNIYFRIFGEKPKPCPIPKKS
jgi:hypothetical protein